jgi:Raf kinase inhibitor-like YbhB/YbcL family protein
MRLWSCSFDDRGRIPERCAFGRPNATTHVELAGDRNPHLAWSDVPSGTHSFALVCHDSDCPSCGDEVNREGHTVPWNLARTSFFHWVLVELPANRTCVAEGEFAAGVAPHGRDAATGPHGSRQGLNDYTNWFAGSDDMKGFYYGYDGPGPPWNDERVHHYHFTLYALDCDHVPVDGRFTGADVLAAMSGHVLEMASITGSYAINPAAH